MKRCEQCKEKFSTDSSRRKFCSRHCIGLSKRTMRPCQQCEKMFHPRSADTKFCSRKCHYSSTGIIKRCPQCKAKFRARNSKTTFCSKHCYALSQIDPESPHSKHCAIKRCQQCEQPFHPWQPHTKLCSIECRRLFARKPESPHSRYHAPIICPTCGVKFYNRSKNGKCQRFCSIKCWGVGYRNPERWATVACPQCSITFRRQGDLNKFCSDHCARLHKISNSVYHIPRPCACCGALFMPGPSKKWGLTKYCSTRCASMSKRDPKQKGKYWSWNV